MPASALHGGRHGVLIRNRRLSCTQVVCIAQAVCDSFSTFCPLGDILLISRTLPICASLCIYSFFSGALGLFAIVAAIPSLDIFQADLNPLAQPFKNAVLQISPDISPRFSLFRRQGCPNLTLLCPNGRCCSYGTSCCGNTCCALGYLCTGGTLAAPCCVAITSSTNNCGSSNVGPLIHLPQSEVSDLNSLAPYLDTYLVKVSTSVVLLATGVTMIVQAYLVARRWAHFQPAQ